MIFAFRCYSSSDCKKIKTEKNPFMSRYFEVVGGMTTINSIKECKRDKACREWAKNTDADFFAVRENGEDWVVVMKKDVKNWRW